MRLFSLIATLLLTAIQGLPPLAPLTVDNTAEVSGVVRRADTGRPISDAEVALMKSKETPAEALTHAVVTDSNGRFTIKNIAGGDYLVVARAEGHFKPADDTPSATWVGKDVSLFEGQQVGGVVLELIPGATVSGRVESLDRERVTGALIEALQANYVDGRMTLREVKTTSTDDLGEYRLFWLPPGDYYIRARYKVATADDPERYPPVFFPGIVDENIAPPVTVAAASEASAIDVRVSTDPVGGVTISGRITDPDLPDVVVTAVYVVPRDRTVTLPIDALDNFKNEASDRSGGQFVIREVPAGDYNLFPIVKDDDGNLRTTRISVNVEDKTIEGISAELSPTVEVRGRVTLDGDPAGNEVALTPLDGLPAILLGGAVKADPKTGEFLFARVQPGQYSVRLAAPVDTGDAYVADLTQRDESIFDRGFSVEAVSPQPVELMIKTEPGVVSGTVFDSTMIRPFGRATVALVPDDPHRSNFVLYRTAVALPNGTFTLTGVAPGEYKLFAWSTVTAGAWENPAFIRRYEDRGLPVVVEPSASKNVRVQVISR